MVRPRYPVRKRSRMPPSLPTERITCRECRLWFRAQGGCPVTINLVFHETNGPDDDVTFQAIADDAGNISNSKFAPDSHDYGVIFTLTATGVSSSLTAQTMFTDGANLDSCANGKATAHTDCEWVNGNLNDTKSHYLEGDSVPFRLVIDGLSIGTHTATIAFDSTKGGKHAFDYLTSYTAR